MRLGGDRAEWYVEIAPARCDGGTEHAVVGVFAIGGRGGVLVEFRQCPAGSDCSHTDRLGRDTGFVANERVLVVTPNLKIPGFRI